MEKYHKNDIAPIEGENERDENYDASNPQIDSSRTSQNYNLVKRNMSYTEYINERIRSLHLPTKPRKDAVVMNSFVISSDNDYFKDMSPWMIRSFFSDSVKFFEKRYGKENIISAVVHLDETTPHLHLNLIPINSQGRLSSKSLFDKGKLSDLHTDLHQAVGIHYGLERGVEGNQRKHASTAKFKAQTMLDQAEKILRDAQHYSDALKEAEQGNYSRNKGKLREQAVATVADNKRLKEELERSHKDQDYLYKENKKLREENARLYKKGKIADTLYKENPQEFERILRGGSKPTALGNFFAAVLSLFTPNITFGNSRLQEIEREIEEERKLYEKRNKNFKG